MKKSKNIIHNSSARMDFVGELEVHSNQINAAKLFFDSLMKNKTPYLAALTQSGKTGTYIQIVKLFFDFCIEKNINKNEIEVLIVHNTSDKSILNETTSDCLKAFGTGYRNHFSRNNLWGEEKLLKILHRPDLKRTHVANKKYRIIIFDECHEAINKDGGIKNFTERLDPSDKVGWGSATPFAQYIMEKISNEYELVILHPGQGYYGTIEYFKDGRIFSSWSLTNNGKPSDFWTNTIILDIKEKYKTDGTGYVLIRWRKPTSKNSSKKEFLDKEAQLAIKKSLERACNCIVDIKEFNSDIQNIKYLQMHLEDKPEKLTLVLVKGSMRRGFRMSKNYIRCMIDSPKSKSASVPIQSFLGRSSGYNIKNKNFNIYCDSDYTSEYIQWWNNLQCKINGVVPSTNYSDDNIKKNKTKNWTEFQYFPEQKDVDVWWGQNCPGEKYNPRDCKANSTNDVAKDFFENPIRGNINAYHGLLYILDAPNQLFKKSWDDFRKKGYNPGYYLKTRTTMPANTIITEPTIDLIKENCMLRK